jgi:hypothetical protein
VLFLEARLDVTSVRVVNDKQQLPAFCFKRAGKQRLHRLRAREAARIDFGAVSSAVFWRAACG